MQRTGKSEVRALRASDGLGKGATIGAMATWPATEIPAAASVRASCYRHAEARVDGEVMFACACARVLGCECACHLNGVVTARGHADEQHLAAIEWRHVQSRVS